jgi:hypothetical protein
MAASAARVAILPDAGTRRMVVPESGQGIALNQPNPGHLHQDDEGAPSHRATLGAETQEYG